MPLNAMLVMLSAVDRLFVTVTVWDALLVPTAWSENNRPVGEATMSKP